MVQIDLNDIECTVTRTVYQTASVTLGDVVDNESSVEGYLEYHDEWYDEDYEVQDVEYSLVGYVQQSSYAKLQTELSELKKQVKALQQRAAPQNEVVKEEKE
jgi:hypothetical protein|tara:strand:- start:249 stop:554 length:306 start_codon:yes stop_codon:yes gene_type:complete